MKKKVALITGASSGIGKAIAYEFAKHGVSVIINYISNEEDANIIALDIKEKFNVDALCIRCDVSNEDEVEMMINKIIGIFGKIDILVNNAGIYKESTFMDKSLKDFRKILDVNLIGTFLCSKYAAKIMLKNKSGRIINISSTNGLNSNNPSSAEYDASKAGVISLTYNMSKEFSPYINVNCICPGWVKTPMSDDLSLEQIEIENQYIMLHRFAEPEEIAKVAVFLASSKACYINSSVIKVDGGRIKI